MDRRAPGEVSSSAFHWVSSSSPQEGHYLKSCLRAFAQAVPSGWSATPSFSSPSHRLHCWLHDRVMPSSCLLHAFVMPLSCLSCPSIVASFLVIAFFFVPPLDSSNTKTHTLCHLHAQQSQEYSIFVEQTTVHSGMVTYSVE